MPFDPVRIPVETLAEAAETARIVWFLEDPIFADHWAKQGVSRAARRKTLKAIWQTQRADRKRIKRIAQELHDRHQDDAQKFIDILKASSVAAGITNVE